MVMEVFSTSMLAVRPRTNSMGFGDRIGCLSARESWNNSRPTAPGIVLFRRAVHICHNLFLYVL